MAPYQQREKAFPSFGAEDPEDTVVVVAAIVTDSITTESGGSTSSLR